MDWRGSTSKKVSFDTPEKPTFLGSIAHFGCIPAQIFFLALWNTSVGRCCFSVAFPCKIDMKMKVKTDSNTHYRT